MPLPTRRLALLLALASVVAWLLPGDGWAALLGVDLGILVVAVLDAFAGPSPRLSRPRNNGADSASSLPRTSAARRMKSWSR